MLVKELLSRLPKTLRFGFAVEARDALPDFEALKVKLYI